ncbi:MAG: SDR family oxidoreductase [Saprospiraceae bacterium]|nr:SDR family oxidoreductase [Saprospiraceae bacterium]
MNKRFEGQVAIITGGARGIGEGIGERIAREGGTVVLFDVLADDLQKATETFYNQGLKVGTMRVDITDDKGVKAAIDEVVEQHGRLDIMVNCAGVAGPNAIKITDYSYEDFKKVVDINLNGSFLMTKFSIPHMLKNNYGRILLIASIGGKEGNPGMSGYAASKSGVMGLVKGIGKEYAQTGITVNGLAPAVIATPMNLDTHPDTMAYMTSKIPMGRLGTIEETAAISTWIVSKEASFNTAFVFDLSGGRATY